MQLENMQYAIKQIPNHMWISTYFNFNKIYFNSQFKSKSLYFSRILIKSYATFTISALKLGMCVCWWKKQHSPFISMRPPVVQLRWLSSTFWCTHSPNTQPPHRSATLLALDAALDYTSSTATIRPKLRSLTADSKEPCAGTLFKCVPNDAKCPISAMEGCLLFGNKAFSETLWRQCNTCSKFHRRFDVKLGHNLHHHSFIQL